MNPSSSEMPGLQLPQPVEQAAPQAGETALVDAQAEALPTAAAPERSASRASTPPPTVPLPVPPAPSAGMSAATTSVPNVSTPQVADDTDLIEKEWVAKAKQIVMQTREDPYRQSKDLTVFKADYMQKRYNKTIKLGE